MSVVAAYSAQIRFENERDVTHRYVSVNSYTVLARLRDCLELASYIDRKSGTRGCF